MRYSGGIEMIRISMMAVALVLAIYTISFFEAGIDTGIREIQQAYERQI